jgi:hypothetical protein
VSDSGAQPFYDYRSVLGYFHSEFGSEAIIGGDLFVERSTEAFARDARGVWRRAFPETMRTVWRPLYGAWLQLMQIERARIQLVRNNRNVATSTIGWTKAGDGAATLTYPLATDALRRAGLQEIVPQGRVFRLDNSAGSTEARVYNSGQVAPPGGSPHAASVFAMGTGSFNLGLEGEGASSKVFTLGPTFARYSDIDPAPATGSRWCIRVPAGTVVDFILPQLEAGTWASSPIPNDALFSSTTRDGDTLAYRDAPDPTHGVGFYFSCILSADALALVGTKLWHVGSTDDPQAYLEFAEGGDLRFVVRPGDSAEYSAVVPLYTATREQFVETFAFFRDDGTIGLAAAIGGNVSTLAYLAEDSDGAIRFVGRYADATAWLVEDSFGALRISPYEPDPIIPIYTAGDPVAFGDVMPYPPTAWSEAVFYVGMGPEETTRTGALPFIWKHFRGDHINPAHIDDTPSASGLLAQAFGLALGAGGTPLGTGRSS